MPPPGCPPLVRFIVWWVEFAHNARSLVDKRVRQFGGVLVNRSSQIIEAIPDHFGEFIVLDSGVIAGRLNLFDDSRQLFV